MFLTYCIEVKFKRIYVLISGENGGEGGAANRNKLGQIWNNSGTEFVNLAEISDEDVILETHFHLRKSYPNDLI